MQRVRVLTPDPAATDALDHANIIPNGFDRLFIEFCSRMAELVGGVGAAQWITEFAERFAPPRK